jgi:hypothetical protein
MLDNRDNNNKDGDDDENKDVAIEDEAYAYMGFC